MSDSIIRQDILKVNQDNINLRNSSHFNHLREWKRPGLVWISPYKFADKNSMGKEIFWAEFKELKTSSILKEQLRANLIKL